MLAKWTDKFEEAVFSLLLVTMTLLVFVEVVLRFGFNTGISWAQEVTLSLSAWFVLLGASYGVKVGCHIGVDVFVKMLPRKIHRVLTVLAVVLCLAYCGLILYGSIKYLDLMLMIGVEMEDLPVPKWVPMSVLVLGFSLLIIRFLALLWRVILGRADGFALADEAKESMKLKQEVEESMAADVGKDAGGSR